MTNFDKGILKYLYIPPKDSHKGQNGKLLLIGGSHLFHASVLWALEIASKIVDIVFFSSVPENNTIVLHAKEQLRNGIIVPREDIEKYIDEADAILIGPGMLRNEKINRERVDSKNIQDIVNLEDEGEQTYFLTKYLLQKYPHKKWIIDAGALQMLDIDALQESEGNIILTPHQKEFEQVFHIAATVENAESMAKKYNCIIVLKGEEDIICSVDKSIVISGGNAGMTKGGTGDVLAGLIAALACKNDLFLSAVAGAYFNKRAGESLFEKVGYYFNSTDLVHELPRVMKEELITT